MKRRIKGKSNKTGLPGLVAGKQKTIVAAGLIAVMVFMWARVFFKGAPQAAQASSTTQQTGTDGSASTQPKISFVELPKIAGRNDVIARDFFTPGDWWKTFRNGETNSRELTILSSEADQEVVRLLADKLRLEAVLRDPMPKAWINNKLLAQGDELSVKEGMRTFVCEVVKIEDNTNSVVIRCGRTEVTLKVKQTTEVGD